MERVYLDYQATTPMRPEVLEVYRDALQVVGNPSSIHYEGQRARAQFEEAKIRLAELLDCDPMELILTSGGTESINTWIRGRVQAAEQELPAIVSTPAEHHATIDVLGWLEREGRVRPLWVEVDHDGVIRLDQLADVLHSDHRTIVGITSLWGNNEVGSVQPIREIVALAEQWSVPVHIDAVSALGHLPVRFRETGAEALSVSAHKVGGPVGVGALIVSRHARAFPSLLHGGSQQTYRSGTLDQAGVVAFARALELAEQEREAESARLRLLCERLWEGLRERTPGLIRTGHPTNRLAHNLHIVIPGVVGEVVLYLLDERGFAVSTGSACQAGVSEPSHVVQAMGYSEDDARGALRFTLGRETTEGQIDRLLAVWPEVYQRAADAGPRSR